MTRLSTTLTRRAVGAGLAATLLWRPSGAIAASGMITLKPKRGSLRLRPEPAATTPVWSFGEDGAPAVIRAVAGEELRLRLVNGTPWPLALHAHGLRPRNALDGAGGLTQEPLAPGAAQDVTLTPTEPGTILLRPLVLGGSAQAAEQGLSALLVVEERAPPPVDRDLTFVVDDWRLAEDGTLAPFGQRREAAAAGRLGNVLTVNGRPAPAEIEAPPGARLRLRFANAANARLLQIRFDGMKTAVAAIDSQPTDTFEPLRSILPFPPARRYDVFADMPAESGAQASVVALLGAGVPLVRFRTAGTPVAARPETALPPNPNLPALIRLQDAVRREVKIGGGARPDGRGDAILPPENQPLWTLNGAAGSSSAPLLSVKSGAPVMLTLVNQTAFAQAFHLHGHTFRLLHNLDDGWEPYWLDTLQIPEGGTAKIVFVAGEPGRWLLGSTVLERLDAGLWTWLEVT